MGIYENTFNSNNFSFHHYAGQLKLIVIPILLLKIS